MKWSGIVAVSKYRPKAQMSYSVPQFPGQGRSGTMFMVSLPVKQMDEASSDSGTLQPKIADRS
jgi:hypothetical protein